MSKFSVIDSLMGYGASDELINILMDTTASPSKQQIEELNSLLLEAKKSKEGTSLFGAILGILKSKETLDEAKIHLLNICIQCAKTNEELFDSLKESGVFAYLFEISHGDDPLLQMTSFELISDLLQMKKGIELIVESNELDVVLQNFAEETDSLAIMSKMELLASICNKNPNLTEKIINNSNNIFIRKWNDLMQSSANEISEKLCACNCWSLLCRNENNRKLFLSKIPSSINDVTNLVAHTSNSEVSNAALSAWMHVVNDKNIFKDENINNHINNILLPKLIYNVINRPFQDQRPFFYRLLSHLMYSKKCAIQLLSNDALVTILLSYQADGAHSESKYAKHELQSSIVQLHDDWIASVIGNDKAIQLRAFVAKGAFYIPKDASLDVATESKH